MKLKSVFVTAIGLSLAAVIFAQTNQGSSSQSSSKSGNGQSSSSASGRAYGSGSSSAGGFKNGSANGSSGGSGFGINGKPTHAILYSLDSSNISADDKQRAFDQHTKYLSEQQAKGKVLLFGPWRDLPGSMAIVMGPSDEEATNIARNDPAVRSGSLNFEVRAWNVVSPANSGFPGGLNLAGNGRNGGSSSNSGGGSTRGGGN